VSVSECQCECECECEFESEFESECESECECACECAGKWPARGTVASDPGGVMSLPVCRVGRHHSPPLVMVGVAYRMGGAAACTRPQHFRGKAPFVHRILDMKFSG